MKSDESNQWNIDYYSSLIDKHGISYKSLDWGSEGSQLKRFKVLNEVNVSLEYSILDVGCGLGDFLEWSKTTSLSPNYFGVDITPKMIEEASKRFPDAQFACVNILEEPLPFKKQHFDLVIASGIFTFRSTDGYIFLEAMIKKMHQLSTVACAFNLLSSWSEEKDSEEFCADPSEVLKICKKITPWVVFRHDYHPADFTVYLYKEQQK